MIDRVIEFSVMSNHLHLLCEGKDRDVLARGLQGLFTRIARAVNRALGRSGRVFTDRYHDRVLKTPREVRNALAYVLNNARKHAAELGRRKPARWIDPCSSARVFFGLGSATIQKLEVRWPSGIVQVIEKIPANQFQTVIEPSPATDG